MKKILKANKAKVFKLNETQRNVGVRFIFKKNKAESAYKNNQKQLEEAEQAVQSQKSKKKKISQLIFFILNLVVLFFVLYSQLKNEGVISLVDLFKYDLNGWFFLIALLVLALMMFLKSHRFNVLIKESTGRSRPFLSYKVMSMGRYYDNITPMATGGQPFQIYYLNKRGLSASTAISVPLSKYFVNQFAFMTVSIFCVIYCFCFNIIDDGSVLVKIVSLIGFFLNLLLVGSLIFLSLNEKIGKILVAKSLKFLQKIKIVKNYDKQYNRVLKTVTDYQSSIKAFMKNKWKFLYLYVISLLIIVLSYSFPYFIYCGMVGYKANIWLDMTVKTAMIDIAASLIPLPGGTGMNEFSFTSIFASDFIEGRLFWALLIYRFFSYYFYLIQGLGVIVYDYLIGNKRYEWMKKKWALQGESEVFKQEQYAKANKKSKKSKKGS